MKRIIFFLLILATNQTTFAQNVGIGTTEPLNKLQVNGNLLVNTPTTATSTAPTVAQTKTMVNATTITFVGADSTGRIYDPGGPSGNYIANLLANVNIPGASGTVGIEITAETMGLGTGDSLIIKEASSSTNYLLAVGNGYTTIGKWVFNSSDLYIIFKSNADASTGIGFSLLFKRLYDNSASLPDVSGVTGNALFFDIKNGSFRSGLISNAARGDYSTAMGISTTASGFRSTAMGNYTIASADASTAMGGFTTASGGYSTAMGVYTVASGNYSTAMAYAATASGYASTAMGDLTTASGSSSTAMGTNTISRGYAGTAIGMYNSSIIFSAQTSPTSTTPLFIIGNGDDNANRSNAMVVQKDGNVGIGTDGPDANLHIRHAAGGGLMLENSTDGNQWRIYSASGDNNLTFYNNANTEIADIDDVTGTFNALSDSRYKKNIQSMAAVLPLIMKLNPSYYQFNWQQPTEQRQIGLLAQQAYNLFPELVSYSKEKDLYKMNYAGFSTVAIKAIQEQQVIIEKQEQQIEALNTRLKKIEALLSR